MGRYYNSDIEFISHSGILGMKWGKRRYQNPDGTYTELGKSRRRKMTFGERKKARKNLEKARESKKQKAAFERERQRVFKEGTAQEVYSMRNHFSNEEKKIMLERLQFDAKLSDLAIKDKQGQKFVDGIVMAGQAAEAGSKVLTFVSNTKKVQDQFNGIGEGISGGGGGKKKK